MFWIMASKLVLSRHFILFLTIFNKVRDCYYKNYSWKQGYRWDFTQKGAKLTKNGKSTQKYIEKDKYNLG